jgi:LysM repeat protein
MFKKRYVLAGASVLLLTCLFFMITRCGADREVEVSSPAVDAGKPSKQTPELHNHHSVESSDSVSQTSKASDKVSVAVVAESSEEEPAKPDVEKLILDLRDDDIPYNADWAIYKLSELLPDDEETVSRLIEALDSDDWQQRQIAGYILARWATHTDLSGNRQFLKVMVEALCGNHPLSSMYGQYGAEAFLCGQGDRAVDLLHNALTSDNERQRTYAAFILTVSMNVHGGNELLIAETLNDPAAERYLYGYRQAVLTMCSAQGQTVQPSEIVPDQVYVVQKGDYLSDIAWAFNTDWRTLSLYNCLPDPNLIEVGQQIFIPGNLSVREPEEEVDDEEMFDATDDTSDYKRVVYPGETLEDIARQYGRTVDEIISRNGISDPESIEPGTMLRIPFSDSTTTPVYEHVVYPGETIEDIARQYGTTVEAIMDMNGIVDPRSVTAGKKLLVPISD